MALIAVLWVTSALGLMVGGLTYVLRNEIRTTGNYQQAVIAAGYAQAALQIKLQQLTIAPQGSLQQLGQETMAFEGRSIDLEWGSLTGLIDINSAQPPLLTALLTYAVPMDKATAEQLARAITMRRSLPDARGSAAGFESCEDLLSVPGIDYGIYARIADLITAGPSGSSSVNPLMAPFRVLVVLAEGRRDVAEQIDKARRTLQPGIDTSMLNPAYVDRSSSSRIRLVARVSSADGRQFATTQMVDMQPSPSDRMPWRIYESRRSIIPPAGQPSDNT